MIAHPILASEDDEDLVCRTLFALPEAMDKLFELMQAVYSRDGATSTSHHSALHFHHYNVSKMMHILDGIPRGCFYSPTDPEVEDKLSDRVEKIVALWRTELYRLSPNSLSWKFPMTRLVGDAHNMLLGTRVRFPWTRRWIRQWSTPMSLHTIVLLALYFTSVVVIVTAVLVVPAVEVSPTNGVIIGAVASCFLLTTSLVVVLAYHRTMRALDELFERFFFERQQGSRATMMEDADAKQHTSIKDWLTTGDENPLQPSETQSVSRKKPSSSTSGKPSTKKHARQGFLTISYDKEIGFIDGQLIDAQVVMIGFDEEYRVTLWNNAAEATTGFMESECLGKPLSDLVDSPSGDIRRDILSMQKTRGQSMKIRLRAFATAPVTLFTIVAPVSSSDASMPPIGSILVCANAKDNLKEARAYIHDFQVGELRSAAQQLIDQHTLSREDEAQVQALVNFSKLSYAAPLEEYARAMVYEWEWTTSNQFFGRALGTLLSKCTLVMDPTFPQTLCVNSFVAGTIGNAVTDAPSRCEVHASVVQAASEDISTTTRAYQLCIVIQLPPNSRPFDSDRMLETLSKPLETTCAFACFANDDAALELHFPCQITVLTEDLGDAPVAVQDGPAARVVACTVNVITLLANSVDRHNVSMVLLKTIYVSLTNVQDPRDLEKKIASHDVDVIIADRTWFSTAKSLAGHESRIILIPLIPMEGDAQPEDNVAYDERGERVHLAVTRTAMLEQQAQFVIRSPIQRHTLENLMNDVGKIVEEKKAAIAEREERDKILTLRQDSPWTQGKLLGRGAFGAVYEAMSDLTGGKMAVKMFYFNREGEEGHINDLLNEIKIMCSLNHANIVHYFYCERKDNSVNLFMELCDCSLADYMVARKRTVQLQVWSVLKQVVCAVGYLHNRGIAHRDIKPQNILLKGDTIKLTDFGTSRQVKSDGDALLDTQGTFRYMAPEVYKGEAHTLSCDIWSIGCLALELFGCPPLFMDKRYSNLLGEMRDAVELPAGVSGVLKDFAVQCLNLNPQFRPSAQMLLLHPLLTESPEVEVLPTIFDRQSRHSIVGGVKQGQFSFSSTSHHWSSDGER